MPIGYASRNDTSNNIASGQVLNAADLDGEFDAILVAFNSTTYTDYSGATLNITPSTTSSKIQLDVKFSYYLDDNDGFSIKVIRTVASSDTTVISYSSTYSTLFYQVGAGQFYNFWFDTGTDSPSTTSQCTYKLQIASEGNRTIHIQPQGGNLVLRATEIGV